MLYRKGDVLISYQLKAFFIIVHFYRERGETPSPVSSIQRLSQQDAEGYARLRSLQRHRRPSYSQSSLEARIFIN